MSLLKSLFVGAIIMSSAFAEAGRLRLGEASYGGSGCPAGTASVTVSPDDQALSVLFDQFIAEAGNTTGRRVDRKACNLTIPVHVPQGFSVAVIQTDYRGFNLIPSYGGMSRLNTEYFWAGVRGPVFSHVYSGPKNDDFTISNGIYTQNLVWTPCGASVNLRVNTTIMAQSNYRMDQTMMMVDSADITGGLVYHLQWKSCR